MKRLIENMHTSLHILQNENLYKFLFNKIIFFTHDLPYTMYMYIVL